MFENDLSMTLVRYISSIFQYDVAVETMVLLFGRKIHDKVKQTSCYSQSLIFEL